MSISSITGYINQNITTSSILEGVSLSGFTYFSTSYFSTIPPKNAAIFTFTMFMVWKTLTPFFYHHFPETNSRALKATIRDLSCLTTSLLIAKEICSILNHGLTNKQLFGTFTIAFIVYLCVDRIYQEIRKGLR